MSPDRRVFSGGERIEIFLRQDGLCADREVGGMLAMYGGVA